MWNYNPYQYQTRVVEAVPVDTVDDAAKIQVQIGCSVLAVAKDDSFVAIKTAGMNGASSFTVFDRRPEKPAPEYLTRADVEALIASAMKGAEA